MYNQQTDIENAVIVLSQVEDSGDKIKVRDGKNQTYSFFKTKRDGGSTKAYADYSQFRLGQTVEIGFKQVPYKDGFIRNIISMRVPRTGSATPNAQVRQVSPVPAMNRDETIGVLALVKSLIESNQADLADLQNPEFWQDAVKAYHTGQAAISSGTDENGIRVSDIPF